jgi:hypothetical protein
MDQAEIKATCLTHRFNNLKLSKIASNHTEKKRMDLLLKALKMKLEKWESLYMEKDDGFVFHHIINPN